MKMCDAFDKEIYGNVAVSSKKRCSSLYKKISVFQENSFEGKVIKMFKISSDYHIKIS